MKLDIVVDRIDVRLTRIDDVVDFALVHEFGDLFGRFQTVHDGHVDPQIGDDFCRSRRRVDITA